MLVTDLNTPFTLYYNVEATDTESMYAMELSVGSMVRYILPSDVTFTLAGGVLSLSFSITSSSSLGKIHRLKLKRKVVEEGMVGDWYETKATQRIYVRNPVAPAIWGS